MKMDSMDSSLMIIVLSVGVIRSLWNFGKMVPLLSEISNTVVYFPLKSGALGKCRHVL